jgi:hypothetical protein
LLPKGLIVQLFDEDNFSGVVERVHGGTHGVAPINFLVLKGSARLRHLHSVKVYSS